MSEPQIKKDQKGQMTVVVHHGDIVDLGEFAVEADFGEGQSLTLTLEEFEDVKRGLRRAIRRQIAADQIMETVSRSGAKWTQRVIRQLDDATGLVGK
jgi:hypothetical protein